MQYLVLRPFKTFGNFYKRGDVVDEKEIRSPRIRVSEGKIVPVVSSLTLPEESEEPAPIAPQVVPSGSTNKSLKLKLPK